MISNERLNKGPICGRCKHCDLHPTDIQPLVTAGPVSAKVMNETVIRTATCRARGLNVFGSFGEGCMSFRLDRTKRQPI